MTMEQASPSPENQEPLLDKDMDIPVHGGLCQVLNVKIMEMDDLSRGNVTYRDNVEGITGRRSWEAKPGRQKHEIEGRIYHMDINPIDSFWGPERFTLVDDLDGTIRDQVLRAIIELSPSLPFTEPELEPYQPPLL